MQDDRPPRVRHVTFPPLRRIYVPPFRVTSGSEIRASSPTADRLVCDSCSSKRWFARSFLQTPPRGGSPCCSARGSCHQGPQGTSTPKSLPDSLSLAG